jgi:hypothetical protein
MSGPSGSGRAWAITLLLALFMLINFLDKIVLGLVAVPIMDELQLTAKQFGDIGSGFFWLFAIGGVLGGFLANRFRAGALITAMVLIWPVCQLPIAYTASIRTSSSAVRCWAWRRGRPGRSQFTRSPTGFPTASGTCRSRSWRRALPSG